MLDKSPRFIIDFHRSMLADRIRTETLRRAIKATVRPDDVVLDLGCGTGILSLFALQAGARKVYAVETGGVIELAKAIADRNGLADRVHFVNKTSSHVDLPEKVDLLVTETIGNFGLEEGILGSVIDARQRLLKEGAAILPHDLELIAAPVEAEAHYQRFDLWSDDLYQLDFSPARSYSINNPLWVKLDAEAQLTEPRSLARVVLADVASDEVHGQASYVVTRSGQLHGIGGWFVAGLTRDITLSNAPPLQTPSWSHAFLPLDRPVAVAEGDHLTIRVTVAANGAVWRWQLTHQRSSSGEAVGRAQDQSTFFGSFMAPSALGRLSADHQPRLDPEGEIDYFVLGLMRQALPIETMAQRLVKRFPRRFPTSARGLERIRELSLRYG